MPLGLANAYGYDQLQAGIRQRIFDQLKQREMEQQMSLAERRQALLEAENQRRSDEVKQALEERQQRNAVMNAAAIAPALPMDQNVSPEAAGMMKAGGMSGQLYAPPTMADTESGKPFDASEANPSINLGTAQQQQAAEQKRIIGRLIAKQEPGSAAAQALEYEQATGKNAPAGIFEKPAKPNVPVMRVNPRTGTLEQLGEAPAGAHFTTEPPPKDTSASDNSRLDRSYQYNASQLEKLRTPIAQRVERIGTLLDSLDARSPAADALVAPEILSAAAGGSGSGLRMNEAEISRIIGGRSAWEDLKATLQRWNLDPKQALSLTEEQRAQMRQIAAAMYGKASKKLKVLDDATSGLVDAGDVTAHRRIIGDAKQKLNIIDTGGSLDTEDKPKSGLPGNVKVTREK